jgi:AraC-like DNA-binding protein/mannose-6-phosphate isomerase-like protein (cupin superfamily)
MANEVRTVCYDPDLHIEAYRFEGVKQKFPNHFHDYYVIGFIENGKRLLVCNGRESVIRPGDILLFNPGDNHACQQVSEEALDYRCLNIQPNVMKKMAAEIQGTASLPVFRENVAFNSDLADSLRELHRMIADKNRDFKKEEIFYFLMEQLICEYSGVQPYDKSEEPSAEIQTVCRFIEEHYAEAISLNQFSSLTGLSKYHLLHSFTKQKGISPYSYLETIRIAHAKKLLEEGESPADTAFATGFHDQSHFTNFFKKFIGLTPKQYGIIFQEKQEK